MQQNPNNTRQTSLKLQQIISKAYDSSNKILCLESQAKHWQQILQYKQWTHTHIIERLNLNRCDISANQFQKNFIQMGMGEKAGAEVRGIMENLWSKLIIICLGDNLLGHTGAKLLVKVNLPKLCAVNVNRNKLGVEGITHLTKNNQKNLSDLFTVQNDIGLTGYQSLYLFCSKKQFTLIDIKQDNAIGLMALFASVNWYIQQRNRVFVQRYFIENAEMYKDLNRVLMNRVKIVP